MDIDPVMAMAAFMTQVGARHLKFNFTKAQQFIISHPLTQTAILFAMFYLSTRRLVVAVSLITLYILCVKVLLNENHRFNIFPTSWLAKEGFLDEDKIPTKSAKELYYENIGKLSKK